MASMGSKKRMRQLPPGLGLRVAATAQPLDFQDAEAWLKEVKEEFVDDKHMYSKFLQAMQEHKARRIGIDALIARVKKLFKGQDHLISSFQELFVPQGYARSKQVDKKQDHHVRDQREKEGGRDKHNDYGEEDSQTVVPSTRNAIWIRQSLVVKGFPAHTHQSCTDIKETTKGRLASSLFQHLDKCARRCELCAHVKCPVFNWANNASRESVAYQERVKANLETIYQEILGVSAQDRCCTSSIKT